MGKTLTVDDERGAPAEAATTRDARLASRCVELLAENEQLRRAMESRAVIDQARGMVMVLAPCSRGEAWALLVDVSQHCNSKLREVARALVGTTDGEPLPATMRRALHHALRRHHAAKRR
ncbi:ANTAR domain-containing protein [Streptomyces sp. NPDC023838]|uniref:ANTAR domain-containing protein n=1 Tax=Streptomyces sp. NPDC023838 TaxID=3154325 RepID=UPI0034097F71